MALREFEQVRERIALRIEVRHLVQGALGVLALIIAAFAAGYVLGERVAPAVHGEEPAPTLAAGAAAPTAAAESAAPSADGTPVLPKPAPFEPAPPDQVNAALAADATTTAQAAPPPAKAAQPSVPVMADTPAPSPVPVRVAIAAPVAVLAPVPVPALAPVPVPDVAAGLRTLLAKSQDLWAKAVALAPPPPPPPPPPPALAEVTPAEPPPAAVPAPVVVAKAPPKPQPAQQSSRPAAPSQPATPDPAGTAHRAEVKPAPKVEGFGRYAIQIKAFRTESDAEAFADDLKQRGHRASVSSTVVADKGTFYRVRLGPFASLDAARAAQRTFEAEEGHVTMVLLVP